MQFNFITTCFKSHINSVTPVFYYPHLCWCSNDLSAPIRSVIGSFICINLIFLRLSIYWRPHTFTVEPTRNFDSIWKFRVDHKLVITTGLWGTKMWLLWKVFTANWRLLLQSRTTLINIKTCSNQDQELDQSNAQQWTRAQVVSMIRHEYSLLIQKPRGSSHVNYISERCPRGDHVTHGVKLFSFWLIVNWDLWGKYCCWRDEFVTVKSGINFTTCRGPFQYNCITSVEHELCRINGNSDVVGNSRQFLYILKPRLHIYGTIFNLKITLTVIIRIPGKRSARSSFLKKSRGRF